MPYKDKEKARAASAASMRKRYAENPEKFRKYFRDRNRTAYNQNESVRSKRLASNEESRKRRRQRMKTEAEKAVFVQSPILMDLQLPRGNAMSHKIAGWVAADKGESRGSCPFPVGHPKRTEWMKGYWRCVQGKPKPRKTKEEA